MWLCDQGITKNNRQREKQRINKSEKAGLLWLTRDEYRTEKCLADNEDE